MKWYKIFFLFISLSITKFVAAQAPTITSVTYYDGNTIAGPGDSVMLHGTNLYKIINDGYHLNFGSDGGANAYSIIDDFTMKFYFIAITSFEPGYGTPIKLTNSNYNTVGSVDINWDPTPVITSVTPLIVSTGDTVHVYGKDLLLKGTNLYSYLMVKIGGTYAIPIIPYDIYENQKFYYSHIKVIVGNNGGGIEFNTGYEGGAVIYSMEQLVYKNSLEFCPGQQKIITTSCSTSGNKWQVDTGNGFVNITNNANYNGAQTQNLTLTNIPSSFNGYTYKCLNYGTACFAFKLKLSNNWLNNTDHLWSNPANWSCGTLPDFNTDVFIKSNDTLTLDTDATINTLHLAPGATFIVSPGKKLTLTDH
ncbi:MAG: hypothetical protein V4556_11460 [Bacteroidota bacterium]